MTAGAATLTQLAERQRAAAELAALSQQLERSALQPLCSAWDGYRPRLQQAVQLAARLQHGQGELPALEAQAKAAETQQSLAREAQTLCNVSGSEVGCRTARPTARAAGPMAPAERETAALRELWSQQRELENSRRELSDATTGQQAELDGGAAGQQVRAERDAAEQALNVTLALLERLRRRAVRMSLRAALVPGEPCPVCGSQNIPGMRPMPCLPASISRTTARPNAPAKRCRPKTSACRNCVIATWRSAPSCARASSARARSRRSCRRWPRVYTPCQRMPNCFANPKKCARTGWEPAWRP